MPELKILHGLDFNGLAQFTDYTFFGQFIDNGMITEENWIVKKCGYNPDFQNMKDKKYVQE